MHRLLRFPGQLAAAIAFYTCLPLPGAWALDFQGVARLAPFVGVLFGGGAESAGYGVKPSRSADLDPQCPGGGRLDGDHGGDCI
ncbi:hypothetical protein [Neosynechococcus sphagnicola]|uniref:hypothetical protein n=1 Tax=Neosynechococcus sphagnicola TaxID=1501145 RepID=UPI00138E36E0|nr:hypothetical protein [Neosynechococcus sphagnicola]